VSTGSLRATSRYVPSALGIWLDYASFWSGHANQKYCAPPGGKGSGKRTNASAQLGPRTRARGIDGSPGAQWDA
jgi:hypothetical protein